MSNLVVQVHIKQWDKAQRSEAEVAARSLIPDRYPIATPARYKVLDRHCVVDQHGDDIPTNVYPKGRLKTALLADGSVLLDRFHLTDKDGSVLLGYREANKAEVPLGNLSDGWIQAKYHWRYRVEQADQIYWLYEAFTLNLACVKTLEANYFLEVDPQKVFVAPPS